MVAQVGGTERWGAQNIVQELGVLAEESDRIGPRLWREVLRDNLLGLLLPGLHVLQEGGAASI